MTRILMFVPQYPYPVVGGLEKQAHELTKALLAQGVAVQVVSGRVIEHQADEEIVEGAPVTRIPWCRSRCVRFLRSPWDVARILWAKRHEFDVLHLHQHSWVGLYVIVLAKLLGKPILVKLPNVGDAGLPGVRKRPFGRLQLWLLLRADALIAMTEESYSELNEAGYPAKRVLRTPNGIDLSRWPVAIAREKATEDVCRVVFVGRLTEQKKLDILIDAWRVVLNHSLYPAALHLWGEGPLASDLKAQVARLGLSESVHFQGYVADITTRLPEMDIFVLASGFEGNSNAVLEAMAAGLPVVATAVGGAPMQLGEAGAPFLCGPGDALALAAALRRLIENPALREAAGTALRRRVEQHFDIRRVAEIYRQAYQCLAEGRAEDVWQVAHPVLSSVEKRR